MKILHQDTHKLILEEKTTLLRKDILIPLVLLWIIALTALFNPQHYFFDKSYTLILMLITIPIALISFKPTTIRLTAKKHRNEIVIEQFGGDPLHIELENVTAIEIKLEKRRYSFSLFPSGMSRSERMTKLIFFEHAERKVVHINKEALSGTYREGVKKIALFLEVPFHVLGE